MPTRQIPRLLACTAARRLSFAALLTLAALLSLTAPSAFAAPPPSFGAQGSGAGEFEEPIGVAIDQQSGDSYVVDRDNNRVDKFGPDGEFLFAFGWGVADNSIAAPQVCSGRCLVGLPGPGAGQMNFPAGAAVDNQPGSPSRGDFYVGDARNLRIEKFSPAGEFLAMFGGEVDKTTGADLCTKADLEGGDECGAGVEGSGPAQFERLGSNAIAVGPGGVVYVGERERVQEFSPQGSFESQLSIGAIGTVEQLAVDSVGEIYAIGTGQEGVRKFDPGGSEIGERDPTANAFGASIATGPGDELFVYDSEARHVLTYSAAGQQLSSIAEEGTEPRGIAFAEAAGLLYVVQRSAVDVLALPTPGTPFIEPGGESASEIAPQGAQLTATINPEGGEETTYRFEYGTTTAYDQTTPGGELGGADFEDQLASESISGLTPGTTYHYRVTATNHDGRTAAGPDHTFQTSPPVSILSTSVSKITATTAQLEAELDPHGVAAHYHFEYGPSSSYGTSAPMPDGDAGSEPVTVTLALAGLAPQTTYHFRLVAENALGPSPGPDLAFTTQGSIPSLLPDGRIWELVSPANKHGVSLEAISNEGGLIQAAADGSAITYAAKGPIGSEPQGNRSFDNSQAISRRTASGWATTELTAPVEPSERPVGIHAGFPSEYKVFGSDLQVGALEPEGDTPLSPSAGERTPYLRPIDGGFEPLVTAANVGTGERFGGEKGDRVIVNGVKLIDATPDMSHVVLGSCVPLTPRAADLCQPGNTESGLNLYEWSAGSLELVSVLPDGHSVAEEGGSSNLGTGRQLRHAISVDGNRIVFIDEQDHRLYLRDLAREETVLLDTPEAGISPSLTAPVYQDAGADGSAVFFTDTARLTADSKARQEKPDLYRCEIGEDQAGALTCALTDLTPQTTSGGPAMVLGSILGTDSGAEHLYFVANGALAPGAVQGTCTSGTINPLSVSATDSCNLYSLDASSGETSLVAVLSNRDLYDWQAGGGDLGTMTSRVSPDGRYLAFMSQRPLTGYDNRDAASGERDQEVFLYNAEAGGAGGSLTCASCQPDGARPVGLLGPGEFPGLLVDRPHLLEGQWVAASLPGWTRIDVQHAVYQSRYLSDSGRLFFNSHDALVPQDSNRTQDVYEYEPPGVGSCTASSPTFGQASGGCVGLISSGTSKEESAFLDASESGDNVFFLTPAGLSPEDRDGALDIYDAHACSTASPCAGAPASAPEPCQGEACQGPGQAPETTVAATATFVGPPDPKPKCAKGKVRKNGKCVKKSPGKKHHKKGYKKQKRANSKHGGHK